MAARLCAMKTSVETRSTSTAAVNSVTSRTRAATMCVPARIWTVQPVSGMASDCLIDAAGPFSASATSTMSKPCRPSPACMSSGAMRASAY